MIIIAAILYLVLSGVLNVCRGGGFFRKERKNYFKLPKAVTSILQGACTGILFIFSGLPIVVCAISIAIHAACVLLWASLDGVSILAYLLGGIEAMRKR